MANKLPIIKGQIATLTDKAHDLFHEVGIHVKRTKGIKVKITQHCALGTSFEFMAGSTKEWHLPMRMVKDCFVETPTF